MTTSQTLHALADDVAVLESDNDRLSQAYVASEAARIAAEKALSDHLATHVSQPRLLRVGMSAPKSLWDQRIAEVGKTGVTARRIFFNDGINLVGQRDALERAIADKMYPVLSWKGTPTTESVAALSKALDTYGVPMTATWHHEPRGNMTTAAFRAGSETFLGIKSDLIKVGPILNGFLLNNVRTMAEWEEYSNTTLMREWDFLGVDLYQRLGGSEVPGSQIKPLQTWLAGKGRPKMEILIGEYNSFEASSIAAAGETFLSTPEINIACVWNSQGKEGSQEQEPLYGARLEEFKKTKADPRAAK